MRIGRSFPVRPQGYTGAPEGRGNLGPPQAVLPLPTLGMQTIRVVSVPRLTRASMPRRGPIVRLNPPAQIEAALHLPDRRLDVATNLVAVAERVTAVRRQPHLKLLPPTVLALPPPVEHTIRTVEAWRATRGSQVARQPHLKLSPPQVILPLPSQQVQTITVVSAVQRARAAMPRRGPIVRLRPPTKILPLPTLQMQTIGVADDVARFTRVAAVRREPIVRLEPPTVVFIPEPAVITSPVISGTVTVGGLLTTTDGTWANNPISFAYQWQRDTLQNGAFSNIAAATANTYSLVAADAGCDIRCLVTATNNVPESTSAPSNELGPVIGLILVPSVKSPSWRYVLCDLDWNELGELVAFQRQYNPAVAVIHTASCVIRSDDRLWARVAAGGGDPGAAGGRLKVYDSGGTLRMAGPIISDEETGDASSSSGGATVKITAVDQAFEYTHRFYATGNAAVAGGSRNQDPADIDASDGLLNTAGNQDFIAGRTTIGDGIHQGPFITVDVTYMWKNIMEGISELGGLEGSYEWFLRTIDGNPPTFFMDFLNQVGEDRTATVFLEYGTGRNNVQSYSRIRSTEQQVTRVYTVGGGGNVWRGARSDAAESQYQIRREDVITYGDITSSDVLDALASEHVALRKDPKITVSLTPFPPLAPKYGVDYTVGDYVTARVVVAGQVRVNGAVRIWGASISIDEEGNETPQLQLLPTSGVV